MQTSKHRSELRDWPDTEEGWLSGATPEELLLLATSLALEAQQEAQGNQGSWAMPHQLERLCRAAGLTIKKLWVS